MSVILATWEVEIKRITVQDQPGKKFKRPHLNQWLGAGGMRLSSPASTNRRSAVQAGPAIKGDPTSKTTQKVQKK
jgi:hypothetical protein